MVPWSEEARQRLKEAVDGAGGPQVGGGPCLEGSGQRPQEQPPGEDRKGQRKAHTTPNTRQCSRRETIQGAHGTADAGPPPRPVGPLAFALLWEKGARLHDTQECPADGVAPCPLGLALRDPKDISLTQCPWLRPARPGQEKWWQSHQHPPMGAKAKQNVRGDGQQQRAPNEGRRTQGAPPPRVNTGTCQEQRLGSRDQVPRQLVPRGHGT